MGEVINTDRVSQLPLSGRNWLSLVNLQPGAQNAPSNSTGGRGGMWFNGSPTYGNQLLVDGVDMSFGEISSPPNDQSGGAGTSQMGGISLAAISEVKVDSDSFSAEYGNSVGGVVNLTTKTGTNQFHGEAFEMVQNDVFNAATFFANRGGTKKPVLRWNQFGGAVGGPLKKDKLFFFLNYEGVREKTAAQESGYVPSAAMFNQITNSALLTNAQTFPVATTTTTNPLVGYTTYFASVPDTENDSLARLDYNFGKQRLAVRFSNNWSNYISPTFQPIDTQQAPFHYSNLVVEYTAPLRATMLNEFRFGYARVNLDRKNSTLNQLGGLISVTSPGMTTGAQSEIHYRDTPDTIVDNFTMVHGAHTFKAGTQIIDRKSWRHQDTGLYTYYQTPTDLINNNPYQIIFGIPSDKSLNDWSLSFFGQDEWRISRKLEVNLGLRYEHYTPLVGMWNINSPNPFGSFIPGINSPMFASNWNDWGPRLGVAWDVLGNQKLVVRAGGGTSYLPPQPILYYDFAAIDPRLPGTLTLTPSDVPSGYSLAFPFPKQTFVSEVESNPDLVSQLGINTGRSVADFNTKDNTAGQWNVSVQGALTKDTTLQVAYVGNHTWHLWIPTFPNQFLPGATQRPLPADGNVQFACGCASSSYDALQVSLKQRAYHGLVLDAYYTYSNAFTYGIVNGTFNINVSQGNNYQDPYNIKNSYGITDGEIRHMFVLDHTYLLPTPGFAKSKGYARQTLGGWSLDGIMTIRSGIPVNILAGKDLVRNQRSAGDRPDRVAGVNPYIGSETGVLQWLNPAAFDVNTPYNAQRYGNLSYNAEFSNGGFYYDAAVHKDFKITEKFLFTFRLEMFNIFNHPVLGGIDATVTDPKFGQFTSANAGRTLQLAGTLKF